MKTISLFGLSALLFLLAGCSSVSSTTQPSADLSRIQRVFVEQRLNDNHRLHQLIVKELQRLGLEASSGPLTMMPEETDTYVTYTDQWTWDFRTHMVGLEINLHHPHTKKVLATGSMFRRTIAKKTPEESIREVLGRLFSGRAK